MPNEQEIREFVESSVKDGRITCKVLLDFAFETQTTPAVIGQLCNEMDIKVGACQLGCFR